MTATIPRGEGLFFRIYMQLIQVRCSGMAEKGEAAVNKVSRSKGWCFNHRVMVLLAVMGPFVAFAGETATWWKKRLKLSWTTAESLRRSWAKLQVLCFAVTSPIIKLLIVQWETQGAQHLIRVELLLSWFNSNKMLNQTILYWTNEKLISGFLLLFSLPTHSLVFLFFKLQNEV